MSTPEQTILRRREERRRYRERHQERVREANQKYQTEHREQITEKQALRRKADAEHARAVGRRAYAKDPEKCKRAVRKSLLKTKYGMTPEQVEEMRAFQDGKCLVCLEKRLLVVDHDHSTGKVRALLCNRCNCLLPESATPALLRRLAEYIEHFRS
jgi:hypothetical protein